MKIEIHVSDDFLSVESFDSKDTYSYRFKKSEIENAFALISRKILKTNLIEEVKIIKKEAPDV